MREPLGRLGTGTLRLGLLWVLITGFAAATGPFGTFEVLGLPARFAYWAVIVGLAIGLTVLQKHLLRGQPEALRLLTQIPYGVFLALVAHGMNLVIFPEWGGWADFGFLVLVTLSAVFLVEAGIFLARHVFHLRGDQRPQTPGAEVSDRTEAVPPSPEVLFQRRLPISKRGQLIRLEAQDHYLLVVTDKGSETLLLRMGDAEAELGAVGLRVHRSHWVVPGQVTAHARNKGRDVLTLRDDCVVPVSRSYKENARAAGLF
ncbi:Response regulator of the LytR/AlgR family protein [Phaeobacter sp. CECT 5382]|uniref:LytTR family DNA-binding domain-containing protein n=1 Tax=Phaeobacter sp. CECT 5382 TaxID=1712645 RepID=UPI0006DAAA70|nr:LytTR family DNA-binding domain-containing protein [Phaeobacter sp. CECT 5382]CUH87595.1 Response regulator of the LytR/AlgR family protein [Phaeobacter sp. CECT 5382]